MILRKGELGDAWAVADLYLRARRAAIPTIPPLVHDDDDVRRFFAQTVLPYRELWVMDDDGSLVGLLVLDGDFVDQLYVDPLRTGQGIGTELLEQARRLRPAGLQLWTFQSNRGAQRFYERHGFAEVERTDGSANEEHAPDIRYRWQGQPSVPR